MTSSSRSAAARRATPDSPALAVDRRDAVAAAPTRLESGGGFTDDLIGALDRRAGRSTTRAFGCVAAKFPDFTALA